jgi:hypothetical protein
MWIGSSIGHGGWLGMVLIEKSAWKDLKGL